MVYKKLMRDGNAVSETLGYILIFGIVFTCIGILIVSGNQIISNTEERTMFQGIEQGFNVLSSDLRKTSFDASPMRTFQIRYDGSMQFVPDDFDVVVARSDGTPVYSGGPVGSIRFRSARTPQSISLENDAVVKNYTDYGPDSSVMSRLPRMYVSKDTHTLMVSVVDLEGAGGSMGGQGVADVRMQYGGITLYSDTPADHAATIKVKTDNTNAWKSYFADAFKDYSPVISASGGWVEVTLTGVDEVKVVEYTINVAMG